MEGEEKFYGKEFTNFNNSLINIFNSNESSRMKLAGHVAL